MLDLLSLIRNFREHYDQQPLHIRRSVFQTEHIDSVTALTEYHSFFDLKFPFLFQFLYDTIYYSKSSAIAEFYAEPCSLDILFFQNCYETFSQLFKLHFNHDLKFKRFRNLFIVAPEDRIQVTTFWIESTVKKFDEKEMTNQKTSNSYYDFLLR